MNININTNIIIIIKTCQFCWWMSLWWMCYSSDCDIFVERVDIGWYVFSVECGWPIECLPEWLPSLLEWLPTWTSTCIRPLSILLTINHQTLSATLSTIIYTTTILPFSKYLFITTPTTQYYQFNIFYIFFKKFFYSLNS